ncbi:MAG: hypothetical protein H0W25_01690 [Acidimicrobiia bacterium]|nr:hypothetical protein [Acidimicrobiia bacterium]
MAEPDRLTQDEMAVVLRRAAELEVDAPGSVDNRLSLATVEAAAAEVGLDQAAVRQAVAELRAGMLDGPEPEVLGDDVIVVSRLLPGAVDVTLDAGDRFLSGQMLQHVRDRGRARTYRQREDTAAKLMRKFDFRGHSQRLRAVDVVEVRAVDVDDGVLVRITARLKRPVPPKVVGVVVGAGTAAAVGVGALLLGPDVLLALGLPAGAAVGAGSWRRLAQNAERERRQVTEVLDGFLDELEQGRRPHEHRALEKLRRHATRLRGPWV